MGVVRKDVPLVVALDHVRSYLLDRVVFDQRDSEEDVIDHVPTQDGLGYELRVSDLRAVLVAAEEHARMLRELAAVQRDPPPWSPALVEFQQRWCGGRTRP